jgi:hypothetical protein
MKDKRLKLKKRIKIKGKRLKGGGVIIMIFAVNFLL